jgi:DNA-binding response OmpR family regulator
MAKILVIDDSAGFRTMIAIMLRRAHHQPILAIDGLEGVELFKAEQPALVISDLVMPNKTGVETIHEIRALAPRVPIIAMSGDVAGGLQHRCQAETIGANAVLAKPFRGSELVELVARLIEMTSLEGRSK